MFNGLHPIQVRYSFVVGDTHVGYRHRPSSTKPPWAQAVDNRRTFSRCLTRARDLGIDTVVHAGDVFDHEITQADTDHVHEEIQRTHDAGIPFYFIHGNHDNEAGNETLRRGPDPSGRSNDNSRTGYRPNIGARLRGWRVLGTTAGGCR